MSVVLLGVLIIGGAVALAIATQLVVRRRVSLEVLQAHHTVAGHMLAVVGGMFGILLAFAVVVVWEQYDRAREGAAREANAAVDLFRLTRNLPPPVNERIPLAVTGYLESVIDAEWNELQLGRRSSETQRALDGIWDALTRFTPDDDRTRNLQLAALGQVEELSDRRRLRLLHAEHELPDTIWAVLVVGAVLTVAFANFFGLAYRRSQVAMVASLAGLIALVIFTIWVLDHPYRGRTRIHVEDYRLALELVRGR
ncbi:hypothetical protein [Vulgatibacter sp.]|uniref:bestrophin-like domain n=1 Tax=Vulgatibacter sp. TaxID=1971226 RepID=UPI003569B7C8